MGFHPPYWGWLFWNYKHSAAHAYEQVTEELSPEVAEHIFQWFSLWCRFLPCPSCVGHCGVYNKQNPPRFTKSSEFFEYTVRFHNAVNERTKKLTLTVMQARQALEKNLKDQNISLDEIRSTMVMDWWYVFWFNCTYLIDFRKSKMTVADEADQKAFREYLQHSAYIVPFVAHHPTIRTCWLETIDSFQPTTSEEARQCITDLYNAICPHFGATPVTYTEMVKNFERFWMNMKIFSIPRTMQIREEDHARMLEMQKEQQKQNGNATTATCENGYQIATIVLASVLGLILLGFIGAFLWFRFRHKRLLTQPVDPKKPVNHKEKHDVM